MRWLLLSIALFGAVVHSRPHRDALCSYGTSNYSLSWEFDELSNDVVFRLTATSPAHDFWTGVYFGEEEPFDAIGLFVRNGQIGLVDAHLPAGDDPTVVADDLTNVQSLQFDMVEGRLTAEFARPLSSHDAQDSDLSKCSTFFFPEAEEITRSGQITLPNMSMSRRVCDISRNCPARRSNRHREEQFKREEPAEAPVAAIAETAPAVEAEPEAELGVEKKEASEAPVCNYEFEGANVNWHLDGEQVVFSVSQPNKKGKWWSAFGIGENMQNLRAVLAFTENGKLKKTGAFKSEGYEIPQGLEAEPVIISQLNNKGQSSYEFAASKTDIFGGSDFNGCLTLQLGLYIGKYGKEFTIQKHSKTPTALTVCGWDKCTPVQKAEKIEEIEASGLETVEGSAEEEKKIQEQPKEDGLLFNPFAGEQTASEAPKTEEIKAEEPKIEETPKVEETPKIEEPKVEETPKVEEPKVEATEAPVEEKKEVVAEEPKKEEAVVEEKAKVEDVPVVAQEPTIAEEPKKEEPVVEGSGEAEHEKKEEEQLLVVSTPKPTFQEMEAELAKEAATTVALPFVNGECAAEHKDLKVCSSYFADYMAKVEEWARNHEQTLSSQMWKACTLLSEVKHVPTMCCTIFRETCAEHIKI